MADVFISYSRKDKPKVVVVAAGLRSLGISVWMDDQLRTGDVSYDRATLDALKAATAVLACWSPQSTESEWARSEAVYGRDQGKLLACFVEKCSLLPPFNIIQTEDLADWSGEWMHPRWIALIAAIAAKLGRPQVSDLLDARIANDETTLLAFAQRYTDDPEAIKIWSAFEAKSRKAFEASLDEARGEATLSSEAFHQRLQDALDGTIKNFESWLHDKRKGTTQQPPPSPLTAVLAAKEEQGGIATARERIAVLSADAARTRVERETTSAALATARREIDTLSRQLERTQPSDGILRYWLRPQRMAAIAVSVALLLAAFFAVANFISGLKTQLAEGRGELLRKSDEIRAGKEEAVSLQAQIDGQRQTIADQVSALWLTSELAKQGYWPSEVGQGPSPWGYGAELWSPSVPERNAPDHAVERGDKSVTPLAAFFAHRITTEQLVHSERDARKEGGAGSLLIDVWTGYQPHPTLPGAIQIPGAGSTGALGDIYERKFDALLQTLTKGDTGSRIVIFCLGRNSWESYNALLRAHHAGYTNLVWYRGGIEAWTAARLAKTASVGVYALQAY